jgi:hypothetical protein
VWRDVTNVLEEISASIIRDILIFLADYKLSALKMAVVGSS